MVTEPLYKWLRRNAKESPRDLYYRRRVFHKIRTLETVDTFRSLRESRDTHSLRKKGDVIPVNIWVSVSCVDSDTYKTVFTSYHYFTNLSPLILFLSLPLPPFSSNILDVWLINLGLIRHNNYWESLLTVKQRETLLELKT